MVNNFIEGIFMIDNFRVYLHREHKSSNTIKTYCRCVEEFMSWYRDNKNEEFLGVKKEDMKNYKKYLECVKKQKAETVTLKLCALAMYERFINYNKL